MRGILGALCPDILHCSREGLIKIVCEVLMDMLPSARKVEIDRLVKELFVDCPKQTTRNEYPRIKWANGITHVTTLAGHEWIGVLLTMSIVANTAEGRKCFTPSNKTSVNKTPRCSKITQKRFCFTDDTDIPFSSSLC